MPIIDKNPTLAGRKDEIRRAFRQNPNVPRGPRFSSILPVYKWPVKVIPEGSADTWTMLDVHVDEDFVDLMGIELIAGRNFSRDRPQRC